MSPDRTLPLHADALRPSEYTAALIQALRADPGRVRGRRVLELGSGSGVVLAALASLGAASMCGIDIEDDAVVSGARLLDELGLGECAEFHRGDMWRPVGGRRFDLIVANLPHFPMERPDMPGRLPTWSSGGRDGRHLLDPFLEGVDRHLDEGGSALITHNAFVDLAASRAVLGRHGLELRVELSTLVYISSEKLARVTDSVRRAEEGRTIHRYGPYAFGEMHIVEIVRARTPG